MKDMLKKLILIVTLALTLTGCVKFNANMDIKKDKSMDFSIIYAFDTSVFGEEEPIKEKDKKNIAEKGFKVEDYKDGNMSGIKISKSVSNIDTLSAIEDAAYNLSGIMDDKNTDEKMFKIEKSFFKNKYKAKLKFNAEDSDINTDNVIVDEPEEELTPEVPNEENSPVTAPTEGQEPENNTGQIQDPTEPTINNPGTINEETYNGEDIISSQTDSNESNDSDFDLSAISELAKSMDLSFNVTLPYSALSSNATTKNNDNKELTWNLSSEGEEFIEFEFELYNMTNIYLTIGGGIFLVIVIIVVLIFVIKNNKKGKDTLETFTINNAEANNLSNTSTIAPISSVMVTKDQAPKVVESPVTLKQEEPNEPALAKIDPLSETFTLNTNEINEKNNI